MSITPGDYDQRCIELQRRLAYALRKKDARLDQLVELAAKRTDAAFTFISLVSEGSLRAVAQHGLDVQEVSIETSFFRYVGSNGLLIADASGEWRFRYHPLVLSGPCLRSYAASPVVVENCLVGSLAAASPQTSMFGDAELKTVAGIAGDVEEVFREKMSAISTLRGWETY